MSAVGANAHSADGLNCFRPALPARHTANCTLTPSLLSHLLGLAHTSPLLCLHPVLLLLSVQVLCVTQGPVVIIPPLDFLSILGPL